VEIFFKHNFLFYFINSFFFTLNCSWESNSPVVFLAVCSSYSLVTAPSPFSTAPFTTVPPRRTLLSHRRCSCPHRSLVVLTGGGCFQMKLKPLMVICYLDWNPSEHIFPLLWSDSCVQRSPTDHHCRSHPPTTATQKIRSDAMFFLCNVWILASISIENQIECFTQLIIEDLDMAVVWSFLHTRKKYWDLYMQQRLVCRDGRNKDGFWDANNKK
jgi:hypothetical protein